MYKVSQALAKKKKKKRIIRRKKKKKETKRKPCKGRQDWMCLTPWLRRGPWEEHWGQVFGPSWACAQGWGSRRIQHIKKGQSGRKWLWECLGRKMSLCAVSTAEPPWWGTAWLCLLTSLKLGLPRAAGAWSSTWLSCWIHSGSLSSGVGLKFDVSQEEVFGLW